MWLFLRLFGYFLSDSRKSAQKGPKSDPIFFKICMSPLYSQMRVSTKFEENRKVKDFEGTFSMERAIYYLLYLGWPQKLTCSLTSEPVMASMASKEFSASSCISGAPYTNHHVSQQPFKRLIRNCLKYENKLFSHSVH